MSTYALSASNCARRSAFSARRIPFSARNSCVKLSTFAKIVSKRPPTSTLSFPFPTYNVSLHCTSSQNSYLASVTTRCELICNSRPSPVPVRTLNTPSAYSVRRCPLSTPTKPERSGGCVDVSEVEAGDGAVVGWEAGDGPVVGCARAHREMEKKTTHHTCKSILRAAIIASLGVRIDRFRIFFRENPREERLSLADSRARSLPGALIFLKFMGHDDPVFYRVESSKK